MYAHYMYLARSMLCPICTAILLCNYLSNRDPRVPRLEFDDPSCYLSLPYPPRLPLFSPPISPPGILSVHGRLRLPPRRERSRPPRVILNHSLAGNKLLRRQSLPPSTPEDRPDRFHVSRGSRCSSNRGSRRLSKGAALRSRRRAPDAPDLVLVAFVVWAGDGQPVVLVKAEPAQPTASRGFDVGHAIGARGLRKELRVDEEVGISMERVIIA